MYGQLAKLRTSNGMAELNLFKAFGLDYRYVEQGNDVDALVEVLNEVKDIDHPIVVHIHTTKGLGFNDETEADNGSDGCNQTNPQPHAGQCEANHWQDPEPRSANRSTHANIMAKWPWHRWNVVSTMSRDWWSSPPQPPDRMASPEIS